MNDEELDRRLERLAGAAFELSLAQEDALWRGFERRRARERQAWAAYTAVMLQLNGRLRPALHPLEWLRRGLPVTTERGTSWSRPQWIGQKA